MKNHTLLNEGRLSTYVSDVVHIPTLSKDEEFTLANQWKEKGDKKAIDKIISSHLKLVVKIAKGYAGYGLSISDLIAEGNLGIMQAVKHFDPNVGYRFSTYAAWWIKAKIQEFIYNSWSIVKLSSSKSNKKLFFGLRKLKRLLGIDASTDEEVKVIAKKMEVSEEAVKVAEKRFNQRDFSTSLAVQDNSGTTWVDFIEDTNSRPDKEIFDQQEHDYRKKVLHDALNTLSKKERDIVCLYRLSSPPKTLQEIGKIVNLSAERVRQLEKKAFLKIQSYVSSCIKSDLN